MSTDIATPMPAHHETVARLVKDLNDLVEIEQSVSGSVDDFTVKMMADIIDADSLEDIFAAADSGTIASKDFIDHPFVLSDEDITWRRSDDKYVQQTGFPFFAILNVQSLLDGEIHVVSAGGLSVVATLRTLQVKGYLREPMSLRFAAREAGKGTVVLLKPYIAVQPSKNAKK